MLWGTIIQPWLSQRNAAEEPEVDEKKQRKLDRKMRRMRWKQAIPLRSMV